MSFYHWFSSHPNEITLSGNINKMRDIGKELRIAGANQPQNTKQTDFRRISSVPDIWSQHRLFEMLLLNKAEDPSYTEYEAIAKREWRAMLALLVLAESYGVEVHTKQIVFPQQDVLREEYKGSGYLFAAYNARPNRDTWQSMEVYYIEAAGTQYPIAMSSPTVHVIPTKDAWRNLRAVYPGQIPWLTDNQVHAPVEGDEGFAVPFKLGEKEEDKVSAMMPVHALMLQRWIARYREELAGRQRNKEALALLQSIKLLSSYEDALEQAFRLNALKMPDLLNFFETGDQQVGMKIGNLRVPKNLKIFLNRVLYARIDQDSAQEEILDTNRFAGGIAKECLVSNPQGEGKFSHFFVPMPVTDIFWQLWRDNQGLNPTYSVRCLFSKDGLFINRIKASIALGDIVFSKTFSIAQIEEENFRKLCTAGIWPRQKIADWSDYYLFCNEIGGYRLEPENRETIVRETPYGKHDGTDGPMTYYRLSSAPDCCAMYKNGAPIGYLKIRDREEIEKGDSSKVLHTALDLGTSSSTLYTGVNMAVPAKISGMHHWSLPLLNSIDEEGRDTSRLERFFFPPLPMLKKNSGSIDKKAIHADVSFQELLDHPDLADEYPSCIPMQSLLADAKENNSLRDILSDSWIYFRSFLATRDTEKWPFICSNLKWMRADEIDQQRIYAMLTEMLVMLALEARCQGCGKITVTATYPLSFEDSNRITYYKTLNSILGSIGKTTGVEVQKPQTTTETLAGVEPINSPLVSSITESEAAFRFSVNEDSYNQNYFIVDIGGGSTDIFISLMDDNNHRNSLATSLGFGARKALIEGLCAGDYFFLRELMRTTSAGLDTVIRDQAKYVREFSNNNRDSLVEDLFSIRVPRDEMSHAADLLPANFGEAFQKTCAMYIEGTAADELKGNKMTNLLFLKKRVAFYLGAVIWLSGLMLKTCENQNVSVSLLFAGNGSKMIRWLAPDMQRTRYFIQLLLEEASGISLPQAHFNCRFSKMPKEEVAFGALLGVKDEYFSLGAATASQVQFGNQQHVGDTPAYRSMEYEQLQLDTDYNTFVSYLRAFRNIAKLSFDWSFDESEYNPSVLNLPGILGQINGKVDKLGFFLGALEVVSGKYLQDFDNTLREKGIIK